MSTNNQQRLWNRNFKIVVMGQSISVFATAIIRFSLSLYILDLTKSPTIFGIITALTIVPMVLLSPVGGVLADRFNKKKLMVLMDFFYGCLSILLFLAIQLNIGLVIYALLMVLLSVVSAFETPVVQSSIPMIQEKEQLVQANAVVNQIAMVGNFIGPILAGILYSVLEVEVIFIFSSSLFFLAAVIEQFVQLPFVPFSKTKALTQMIQEDIQACWSFLKVKEPTILKTIIFAAGISFFVSGLQMIGVPYIIRLVLTLNSQYVGINEGLLAFAGVAGGVLAGTKMAHVTLNKFYLVAYLTSFILLLTAGLFAFFSAVMVKFIGMTGLFMSMQIVFTLFSILILSSIQARTPSHLLGKVMSFVITITMCSQPIAQLIYGSLFEAVGENVAFIFLGTSICLLMTGFWAKLEIKEPSVNLAKVRQGERQPHEVEPLE